MLPEELDSFASTVRHNEELISCLYQLFRSETEAQVRFVCLFMVFNATFNNVSVISWWSVLMVEETGEPGEKH